MDKRSFDRRTLVKLLGTGALLVLAPSVLAGCDGVKGTLDAVLEGTREFTDDAGRDLVIPIAGKLERVYFTSNSAQIFCFTLDPSVIAGTTFQFTKQELEYLPEGTSGLTYMGSLSGDGEINREMLMVEDVQLVFSISTIGISASNVSDANDLQNATGIPVVCLDGSMEKIAACYRRLGDVLGCADRAEELAKYCENVYGRVTAAVAAVPEVDRTTLYYAEGPEGLQTEPDASQHALAFAAAGAINVAAVPENEGQGMSNVSLEQVLAWDPEVIVAWDEVVRGGADAIIRRDPNWSTIKAVQDGRVYTMPNVPFAWCDRPPAVNRFMGIQWLANMLYPDAYDVDMVEATKSFYSTMYWVDITDDQAKEILGNSYPPYRG